MILADTGYFIALLRNTDSLHLRAVRWTGQIYQPVLVTEYVIWELVNNLSAPGMRFRLHRLVEQIRTVPAYRVIPASPDLFEAGLALHARRPDKEWSLTDCISFHVMEQHGVAEALAYDHHFEQAGFTALLRRDP
jgi:predicted nucleic acid-binding protein